MSVRTRRVVANGDPNLSVGAPATESPFLVTAPQTRLEQLYQLSQKKQEENNSEISAKQAPGVADVGDLAAQVDLSDSYYHSKEGWFDYGKRQMNKLTGATTLAYIHNTPDAPSKGNVISNGEKVSEDHVLCTFTNPSLFVVEFHDRGESSYIVIKPTSVLVFEYENITRFMVQSMEENRKFKLLGKTMDELKQIVFNIENVDDHYATEKGYLKAAYRYYAQEQKKMMKTKKDASSTHPHTTSPSGPSYAGSSAGGPSGASNW